MPAGSPGKRPRSGAILAVAAQPAGRDRRTGPLTCTGTLARPRRVVGARVRGQVGAAAASSTDCLVRPRSRPVWALQKTEAWRLFSSRYPTTTDRARFGIRPDHPVLFWQDVPGNRARIILGGAAFQTHGVATSPRAGRCPGRTGAASDAETGSRRRTRTAQMARTPSDATVGSHHDGRATGDGQGDRGRPDLSQHDAHAAARSTGPARSDASGPGLLTGYPERADTADTLVRSICHRRSSGEEAPCPAHLGHHS